MRCRLASKVDGGGLFVYLLITLHVVPNYSKHLLKPDFLAGTVPTLAVEELEMSLHIRMRNDDDLLQLANGANTFTQPLHLLRIKVATRLVRVRVNQVDVKNQFAVSGNRFRRRRLAFFFRVSSQSASCTLV